MILFFDCETTGLPDFNKRARDPAQPLWWKQLPTFCTMRSTTNICKLPGSFAGQYKWPKLQEAYQHAFGDTFDGAHDALADVRACARIYRWLQTREAEVAA